MSQGQRSEDVFQCPVCQSTLQASGQTLVCETCPRTFEVDDGIPMLFWPTEDAGATGDVSEMVKAFYEETPFPHYNDFDNVAMFAERARRGIFARMLDERLPPGARVIECGCGTGQFSNFLSIANRTVYAADMCVNSLRLGQKFARDQHLKNVHFVQMNLFRPVVEHESFDLVISNGVLLTTIDPGRGFRSIARLVKPGGHILIGLYNTYGRLITDARRVLFRYTGDRLHWLDPNLRDPSFSEPRKRAWFADQYIHPHETKQTIGEVMGWFEEAGFDFVRSIPNSKPFRSFSARSDLFEPEEPGTSLERKLVQLGMIATGSREGGFFTLIGRKR